MDRFHDGSPGGAPMVSERTRPSACSASSSWTAHADDHHPAAMSVSNAHGHHSRAPEASADTDTGQTKQDPGRIDRGAMRACVRARVLTAAPRSQATNSARVMRPSWSRSTCENSSDTSCF
jgi:hypothetical protein